MNANARRSQDLGAKIRIGHFPEHVAGAEVVVISSAVNRSNPEVEAARKSRIPRHLREPRCSPN